MFMLNMYSDTTAPGTSHNYGETGSSAPGDANSPNDLRATLACLAISAAAGEIPVR